MLKRTTSTSPPWKPSTVLTRTPVGGSEGDGGGCGEYGVDGSEGDGGGCGEYGVGGSEGDACGDRGGSCDVIVKECLRWRRRW